jgi:hypothetical protein
MMLFNISVKFKFYTLCIFHKWFSPRFMAFHEVSRFHGVGILGTSRSRVVGPFRAIISEILVRREREEVVHPLYTGESLSRQENLRKKVGISPNVFLLAQEEAESRMRLTRTGLCMSLNSCEWSIITTLLFAAAQERKFGNDFSNTTR